MIHYTQVRQQELTSCPRRTWGNMKPAFPGTSTLPENTGLSISGSQSPPITKKALDPTSRSFVHKQVPATTPRSIPCLPGPTEQLPHPINPWPSSLPPTQPNTSPGKMSRLLFVTGVVQTPLKSKELSSMAFIRRNISALLQVERAGASGLSQQSFMLLPVSSFC